MTPSQAINRIWGFLARHKNDPDVVKAAFETLDVEDEKLAEERNLRANALASTILSRERLRSLLDAELRESDVEAVSQEEIERLREDEMLAKYFGAAWLEEHHA